MIFASLTAAGQSTHSSGCMEVPSIQCKRGSTVTTGLSVKYSRLSKIRDTFGLLSLLLLLALSTSGCQRLMAAIEEEVEQYVAGNDPDTGKPLAQPGEIPESPPPAPTVDASVTLNSIQPNRGPLEGGTLIDVVGTGFLRYQANGAPAVTLGRSRTSCTNLQVISDNLIRCLTPEGALAETVTLRLQVFIEPGITAEVILANAFTYYSPVVVEEIQPTRLPSEAGQRLFVLGEGFVAGTQVKIAGREALQVSLLDDATLQVLTPALPAGLHDVVVSNLNGEALLPAALRVYDPLSFGGISPQVGTLVGGESIQVSGGGFIDPSLATLGDRPATTNSLSVDGATMAITSPGADSEGLVDLVISNDTGVLEVPSVFTFIDSTREDPRIISLWPRAGPIEGGNRTRIVAANLEEPWQISFDGTLANCSSLSSYEIECVTPSGTTAGLVDISLVDGAGTSISLSQAYRYIDLGDLTLSPADGAIAGNTALRLAGNNLNQSVAGAQVNLKFEGLSSMSPETTLIDGLEFRSPRSAIEGPREVSIQIDGYEFNTDLIYTYFDPSSAPTWTSGGPIDGAVNVTVVQYPNGNPIAGAFVMLNGEADNAPPWSYGYTNDQGQIVLSSFGLNGIHAVHGGKQGYGNASFFDLGVENLILGLSRDPAPPPDPLPECPEPTSVVPPVVRGDVVRIKDEFNLGDDTVIVTTTQRSFSEPLPDPGPNATVLSNGPYELVSRSGDLSLIALAGYFQEDGSFKAHAMGLRPFMNLSNSSGDICDDANDCAEDESCLPAGRLSICTRVYEDADILIDTPINETFVLDLMDPPYGDGEPEDPNVTPLPSYYRERVWYDFGSMGVWQWASNTGAASTQPSLTIPGKFADGLEFIQMNVDFSVAMGYEDPETGRIYTYSPQSDIRYYGNPQVTTYLLGAPFLKVHNRTDTAAVEPGAPIPLSTELLPSELPDVRPTANLSWLYDIEQYQPCDGAPMLSRPVIQWMVLSDGPTTSVQLPQMPNIAAGLSLPSASYYWQLQSFLSENTSYDALGIAGLYNWRARSLLFSTVVISDQSED